MSECYGQSCRMAGEEDSAGCTERSFILRRPVPVPGVLWTPQATAPHKAGGHIHLAEDVGYPRDCRHDG